MLKRLIKRWKDWRAYERFVDRRPLKLSKRDYRRLLDQIENPPKANEKLKQLMRDGAKLKGK